MRWSELFLGMAVLVGFWLLKIIAELVWEGLKVRLRRELKPEVATIPAIPVGGADLVPLPPNPDEKPPSV